MSWGVPRFFGQKFESIVLKKMALCILPQYLENLTQLIGANEAIFFFFWGGGNPSQYHNIVYARFEGFRTFLCIFMNVLGVFVHVR